MEIQEKYRIKSFLRKVQIVKGKRLTKKERLDVVNGYMAMKGLGIFKKPDFNGNRKILDKHMLKNFEFMLY